MEKPNWDVWVKRLLLWQWVAMTAGVVAEIGVWIFFGKHLPPQVPLFYSRPWGDEQLANTVYLILPAGIAALLALVITFLVSRFNVDKVLTVIMLGAGIIAEIMLLLSVLRAIIIVM